MAQTAGCGVGVPSKPETSRWHTCGCGPTVPPFLGSEPASQVWEYQHRVCKYLTRSKHNFLSLPSSYFSSSLHLSWLSPSSPLGGSRMRNTFIWGSHRALEMRCLRGAVWPWKPGPLMSYLNPCQEHMSHGRRLGDVVVRSACSNH